MHFTRSSHHEKIDSEAIVGVTVLAHGVGLHHTVAHTLDDGLYEHQEAEGEAAETGAADCAHGQVVTGKAC